ncbi:MAG: signal peptidase II [Candidatus Nanoarchaeia archaeon]
MFLLIGLILLVLDQYFKNHFLKNEYYFKLVSFHLVTNTGASFGILKGSTPAMIIVSFIFLGLLFWFRNEFKDCTMCLVLLAAGTIGNLIDRIFLGHVIDFIDLGWFPVFNLADAMITLGTIGLIWMFIMELRSEYKDKKNRNSEKKGKIKKRK